MATILDATARGIHNATIGIAILATEDGPIIRYSFPDDTDAAAKADMPDKDHLTAVLSNAVHIQPM